MPGTVSQAQEERASNIFEKVGVRSRRGLVKQLFFEQVLAVGGA